MTEPSNPDVQLVKKAARGDRKAFTTLFNRHFQAVYNYALMLSSDPALAEDLTQEAFIRAHTNLDRFGPPWNFRTWVFRLTHNYFIDLLRKDRDVDPLEEGDYVRSAEGIPERETIRSEAADRVQETLGRLGYKHREILILRELHGFSYTEIGEILDISQSNVKVLIHRARSAFQELYGFRLLLEDSSGDCQEVSQLLHLYHDQEDLLDQERLVKEHLKVCEACQRRKQWLVEQSLVLGALIPVVPPKALAQRILEQTSGLKGSPTAQKPGLNFSSALGIGGAAAVLGAAAWLLIYLLGGGKGLPPNLPPISSGVSSPEVIAFEEPVPSDTADSPPPPPPPLPPQGPTPTPTPEPESLASRRCDLIQDLEISLVTLPLPEETMVLPVYLKMQGGVPCLGVESPDVAEPCEYRAALGNIEAYTCGLQGFEDRLYCLFRMTPDLPGQVLVFELFLNDCLDPVLSQPGVIIPEIRSNTLVCSASLSETDCLAAGGKMSDPKASAPYCICP